MIRIAAFRKKVRSYYRAHGRDLPWRRTRDPYKILVSEVMLQQTQVDRVIPKYEFFLKRFPDFASLARASFSDVYAVWQGLGYNRRARSLQRLAVIVMRGHKGVLPRSVEALRELPGVGAYTAAAIAAFAWNVPSAFLETNIRTVLIHSFFLRKKNVGDKELMQIAEKTLDKKNPREWYWALMDYGVYLKKIENYSRRSATHRPQSRFKGSRRELRGRILASLKDTAKTEHALSGAVGGKKELFKEALEGLQREGFVYRTGTKFILAGH